MPLGNFYLSARNAINRARAWMDRGSSQPRRHPLRPPTTPRRCREGDIVRLAGEMRNETRERDEGPRTLYARCTEAAYNDAGDEWTYRFVAYPVDYTIGAGEHFRCIYCVTPDHPVSIVIITTPDYPVGIPVHGGMRCGVCGAFRDTESDAPSFECTDCNRTYRTPEGDVTLNAQALIRRNQNDELNRLLEEAIEVTRRGTFTVNQSFDRKHMYQKDRTKPSPTRYDMLFGDDDGP